MGESPAIPVNLPLPSAQQVADFFCAELLATWRLVRPEGRPPNVWLRQHEAFSYSDDVNSIPTPVVAAWLLQDGQIKPRTVSEFLRFYVMQGDRPWASGAWPPPSVIFGGTQGPHEFGLAAFAPIAGSNGDYYFFWQFGGLHGRGSRYAYSEADGAIACTDNLWIS